jgi:hypothetical protein
MVLRRVRLPTEDGIGPTRRLLYSWRVTSPVRLPTEDGIVPPKLFIKRDSVVSLVRLPKVEGIDPAREVEDSWRELSPVILPKLGGRVPLMAVLERLMETINALLQVTPLQLHFDQRVDEAHPDSPRVPILVDAMTSSRKYQSGMS